MLFSSITFLYYFLPVALLLYYAAPGRWKNAVLFAVSFLFYAWGEPKYCLLLLFAVTAGYVGGIVIERGHKKEQGNAAEQDEGKRSLPKSHEKNSTAWLILFLGITIGLLMTFKYGDFLVENVNALWSRIAAVGDRAGTENLLPLPELLLPLGISFYTFQIVSYLVDVYRGEIQAERNFISFGAYVMMFPQLVAGPIVRYSSIAEQMRERNIGWDGTAEGSSRFVCGLAKKVLIADQLSELVGLLDQTEGKGMLGYWMLAAAFTLQIYYDFSGYSDMAIGLGRMLGFTFPENFRYPFMSKSVTEFWRRWHMSLGSWFRDYVYIPLGGSRVVLGNRKEHRIAQKDSEGMRGLKRRDWLQIELRKIFNVLVVWALSGLWHGASWNFVLWGLYFGVLLLLERGVRAVRKKRSVCAVHKRCKKAYGIWSLAGNFYTVIAVVISFVIFRQENLTEAWEQIGGMFAGGFMMTEQAHYVMGSYVILFGAAVAGVFPVWQKVQQCMNSRSLTKRIGEAVRPVVTLLLLVLVTAYLIGGTAHPFLYFRF